MSEDNIENLPSIEDYKDNSEELPSVDEFISEEKDLPSIGDFIEKEEIQEEVKTDNWRDDYTPTEYETFDVIKAPQWGELVRMVNDVRESIPDIPEIKYYDKELQELSENLEELKGSIPEVPEVKYYDAEVQAICKQIDLVREEIQTLPEVKYYDEQLSAIEEKIQNLPEPKYYEGEIKSICEAIDEVRDQIPTFPKWVNEVNEVPDFSWIGKTFSVIDDDFVKVKDHLTDLKTQFDSDIHDLTENLDTKDFEKKVEIKEVSEHLNETKDKIYEEIKDAVDKIWSHHNEFKDDDRKLKKSVLSKLNETRQKIESEISESNKKYRSSNRELKDYLNKLQLEIDSLPEIKDYDESIGKLKKNLFDLDKQYRNSKTDIVEIYKIVEELKETQKQLNETQEELSEGLLNDPPNYEQSVGGKPDPLTPLDKKFATVEDLSKHYTTFVNRVQQQLATFGGGGAVELQYLDDISGISTNISAYDGMQLVVDLDQTGVHKGKKFKFTTVSGGSTTLTGLSDVDDSNLGDGRFLRYDATAGDFTFDPVSSTNLELIGGDIQGGILTTTSTSAATVISVSASTYRSVNYQVQVVQGTNYNRTTINVIHDGTNAYMSEYGTINQPTGIATFGTDINSGSLRLLGYPASSSSTTFKSIFTALEA